MLGTCLPRAWKRAMSGSKTVCGIAACFVWLSGCLLAAGTAPGPSAEQLAEQARQELRQASSSETTPEKKITLVAQARADYAKAREKYDAIQRDAVAQLKLIAGQLRTPGDTFWAARQQETQRDGLRAELASAGVLFELGRTYPPTSRERDEHFRAALAKYEDIHKRHPMLAAGLYARMWQGRIHRELRQPEKAIAVLEGFCDLPDDKDFRPLRDQSLILLLETYLLPEVKRYSEAVAKADKWWSSMHDATPSADALVICFLAGQAAVQSVQSDREEESAAGQPGADRAAGTVPKSGLNFADPSSLWAKDQVKVSVRDERLNTARRYLGMVTQCPGPWQNQARQILANPPLTEDFDRAPPVDFDEARQAGDLAWQRMCSAQAELQEAGNRPPSVLKASASARPEARSPREEFQRASSQALRYYETAIRLAPGQIPRPMAQRIQFRRAYLAWASGRSERAAVLAEDLARQVPQAEQSRGAAAIAAKAYRNLIVAAGREEDRRALADRLQNLVEYAVSQWPGQIEADEGWMLLIDTAAEDFDVPAVEAFLSRIAADSPRRGQAELRAGTALWAAHLRGTAAAEGQRPEQPVLDALAAAAGQRLRPGFFSVRSAVALGERPSPVFWEGTLALAQYALRAGKADEAVALVDDPQYGIHRFAATDGPGAARAEFRIEACRTTLRAYVVAGQFEKAQQAAVELDAALTTSAGAQAAQTLLATHIRLGQEIGEMVKRLREGNQLDEMKSLASGFEVFVHRLASTQKTETFGSLCWIAETCFALGSGMDSGDGPLTPEANRYYLEAASLYRQILTRCRKDAAFAPRAEACDDVAIRLAACLRAMKSYTESIAMLTEVLHHQEHRLDAQMEAARTYQQWGRNRAVCFEYAIRGAEEEHGRFLIWGWGGIAARVEALPQHRAVFHEARYNLARCRLERALGQQASARAASLKLALRDIVRVYQSAPDLGGSPWKAKYEALFREIQQYQGVPPESLQAAAEAIARAESR